MTSLPEALALAAASFISGMLAGQFVRFRRIEAGDRTLLKPEFDRRPFAGPWFKVVVIVLFLAAVGLTVHTTTSQRMCNEEFRRTITMRADIAQDDNQARKLQDQAVAEMVKSIVGTEPSPDGRAHARAALQVYLEKYEALNDRQAQNELKRAANPYPQC